MNKQCAHCSAEFAPYRSTSKFCSRQCSWNSRTVRIAERNCTKCGGPAPVKVGLAVCDGCKVDPRDPVKSHAKERRRTLRAYGITEDDYARMLAEQGHCCAVCRTDEPGGRGSNWHIDHDHTTGLVRGLLCTRCNSGLGFFDDNPNLLAEAERYILHAATRGGVRAWRTSRSKTRSAV